MTIGPEPMMRMTSRCRCATASAGPRRRSRRRLDHERRTRRTGTPRRAGQGPASGWCWTLKAGASSTRMPWQTPSLRLTWVIVDLPSHRSAGIDREVVVLARDLDASGSGVADRVVGRRGARRGASPSAPPSASRGVDGRDRCRRSGTLPSSSSMVSTAYGTASGSPGPLLKNTPSGSRASISAARSRRRYDHDVAISPSCDRCCASCRSRARRWSSAAPDRPLRCGRAMAW